MVGAEAQHGIVWLSRLLVKFLQGLPGAGHEVGAPGGVEVLIGTGRVRRSNRRFPTVHGERHRAVLLPSLVIDDEVIERGLQEITKPAALRVGSLEVAA